ncbi:hypothetical protein NAC44_02035 [Allorhizobium sp. BGMRC 0089]|nr:hypothetical protein [Allorhizobium sonneratiae]MCM2291107.1 hypothetical protein [Allorhizobium sonneratiae]
MFGLGWPHVIDGAATAAFDFEVTGKCPPRLEQKGGACAATDIFHFLTLMIPIMTALCLRAERVDS